MNICVYCYEETNEHFCGSCGEYDGIMPHEEADDYMTVRTPSEIAAFNDFVDQAIKYAEELEEDEVRG